MTDYNNGQIHGWNGGECPVHFETVVKFWTNSGCKHPTRAKCLRWKHTDEGLGYIIAFQVVKAYVEPKVIWVNEYRDELVAHLDEQSARAGASIRRPPLRIAVKYVEVKDDAKEAEAYAEELEAKLAKAVEALKYYNVVGHEGKEARAALAEIKAR